MIENFKCHNKFQEDLGGINILAGENAAGKSSIIQSILLWDYISRSKDRKSFSTFNFSEYDIGVASDLLYQNADYQEIIIKIKTKDGTFKYGLKPYDSDDTLLGIHRSIIGKEPNCTRPNYRLYYLNAERIGPQLVNPIVYEGWNNVGIHGQNTVYVMNQLDKTLQLGDTRKKLPDKLKISEINRFSANCEAWLNVIIPGTRLNTKVEPAHGIASIRFNNYGDTYYSPTATGFGLSYSLPIIVQGLIAAMFDNSVLIIENPEAHLHPYSQSMMGKFLAYVAMTGTQVFVETHSEHFVNGCRLQLGKENMCDLAKIFFFYRDGEIKHEQILLDSYGNMTHWPRGFFDQEQMDLREILKLRFGNKE